MPSGRRKAIPPDSLMQLRQRLDRLPHKSPERAAQVAAVAELYGISTTSVYRALHRFQQPHSAHRADYGKPRVLQQAELERYCVQPRPRLCQNVRRCRSVEKSTHQNALYPLRGTSGGVKWHPKTAEFRVLTQPFMDTARFAKLILM
jgi:hypothetical protein